MPTNVTILIAEDEPLVLNVVATKMQGAGYTVLTATDGKQALDLALQHRPHLLISDYHMPMLSGLELCRRLTQAGARTPTILMTATGYDPSQSISKEVGIERLILKPFSPRELLAEVQSMLKFRAAA